MKAAIVAAIVVVLAVTMMRSQVEGRPPRPRKSISCIRVSGILAPCFGYLTNVEDRVKCCPGVNALNLMAPTTTDKKELCNCIKQISYGFGGFNDTRATGLTKNCGVRAPGKLLSPSNDCTAIQ